MNLQGRTIVVMGEDNLRVRQEVVAQYRSAGEPNERGFGRLRQKGTSDSRNCSADSMKPPESTVPLKEPLPDFISDIYNEVRSNEVRSNEVRSADVLSSFFPIYREIPKYGDAPVG